MYHVRLFSTSGYIVNEVHASLTPDDVNEEVNLLKRLVEIYEMKE